jgi:hypothetical protein
MYHHLNNMKDYSTLPGKKKWLRNELKKPEKSHTNGGATLSVRI